MVLLIVILCLLLISLIPLRLLIQHDNETNVFLCFGPFKFLLYPVKKKKTEKEDKEKQERFESHKKVKKKQKTDVTNILSVVKLVLNFLDDFRTKLRVDDLKMHIILADNDPCDLSIQYGRSWAALGSLFPLLERYFIIKNRDVEIDCDFTAEKTVITATVRLSITVGRILTIGLYHGFKILRKYLKIMKKSKDGAAL